MLLPRLENQCWAKTWLGPDFQVRAGPRLGPGPPTRPADSGAFLWAPFRNFFLHVFRCMSRKFFARNAKSGFLSTLFWQFPGNATKHVQKKVPEWGPEKSSGIGRPGWGSWAKPWPSPDLKVEPKPSFGPALIFKSGQKHQKWSEMDPESTVRAENRST